MKRALLTRLLADRAAKRAVVLATGLESGEQTLFDPLAADADGDPALLVAARRALARDTCLVHESEGDRVFLQPHNPPLRMAIVGAVHIAQHLAPMAARSGYEVLVIDPRGSFATDERFPGVTLSSDWPDEAMRQLAPDSRTAVVTLTHDPKLDDPALQAALETDAFYIGSLGSRKTHAARLERLRERGIPEEGLARIHGGPVGLAIGARSPAEIALSILGQVTERLRTEAQ